MHAVSLHQQGGGFFRAQVKDIPDPGDPGKTMFVGQLDNVEGKGKGVPAKGHVRQDRPACLGSPPLEEP